MEYGSYLDNGDWIPQELGKPEYRKALKDLTRATKVATRFKDWGGLLAYMRDTSASPLSKDDILRGIFTEHSKAPSHSWRTVLLAIFWPGLRAIRSKKRTWDKDQNELWSNIIWQFLEVVSKIDPHKRSDQFAKKVINDTAHNLYKAYTPTWRHINNCSSLEDASFCDTLSVDDIDYEGIEARINEEALYTRLERHLKAGRINEETFLLLVGTRVYGKSIAAYAKENGMNYEVARKRRQRAEKDLGGLL